VTERGRIGGKAGFLDTLLVVGDDGLEPPTSSV
jgi:hypothetical protein